MVVLALEGPSPPSCSASSGPPLAAVARGAQEGKPGPLWHH